MKKNVLIVVFFVLAFTVRAQINVATNGNVGINVPNPTYKLQVEGSMSFGCWGTNSTWEKVILDWTSYQYGNPALYPYNDGQLSIGKSDKRVSVRATQIWSDNYTTTSDERIKQDISNLSNSIEKLKLLRGVNYLIKESHIKGIPQDSKDNLQKKQIGFLAQELETVFPELVSKTDSTGLLGINYIGLIPVLVEAIKEQQIQIETLTKQVSELTSNSKK